MVAAKITLRGVAAKAGVAKSTASYALNDSYQKGINIPEETRLRIKKIASEMGYVIDDMARAISTGKTRVLGLVCSQDSIHDNFAPLLGSVMKVAANHDFFIKMFYQMPNDKNSLVSSCVRQRLSAVLFYRPYEETICETTQRLRENGIITAIIGNSITPDKCIHVKCDDKLGSRLMVAKLHELGHQRIAYISSEPEYPASAIRKDGYLEAMNTLRLDVLPDYVWGSKNLEMLKKHVFKLLSSPRLKPDAIFCSGDNIASVVISIINKFGMKVPDDISVAGFGNLVCSQFAEPQISTVDEGQAKISETVMEKILSELSGKKQSRYLELIQPVVILRESTSPIK